MRCLMCETLSLLHICSHCQKTFLSPTIHKRKISDNIEVISFYKYSEIKNLLHTKHTDLGYYIYSILAKNSLKKFAREFDYPEMIASIAVDDYVSDGYSHTAVLNKALKSRCITPLFNKLRAKNRVSYSGKSREFRALNPREFEVKKFDAKNVILVDDIITTNLTLTQALKAMQKENKEVILCLTLADASIK
ncbi:phosphoribosyltransferase family protein [Sulfurimonas sp.]|uniref:ComF family protein n=1 Tax=Sulfurimonas sp. TaxID=2022749 RepID=UPI0025D38142|nr:phosphoribosyltransferase family protein [Sulfurimonas sp.]MBW6489436.1 ComF family protein [Sulfurimonas sp.]